MKYIDFWSKEEEVNRKLNVPKAGTTISGIFVTPYIPGKSTSGNSNGFFASWAPDDAKDWWRSKCGHAVDNVMLYCPACGEKKPKI